MITLLVECHAHSLTQVVLISQSNVAHFPFFPFPFTLRAYAARRRHPATKCPG